MKKFLGVLFKILFFFIGWVCFTALLIPPSLNNAAIWREVIPLVIIIVFTLLFWLLEKRRINILLFNSPLKSIGIGIVTGCVWLGSAVLIMYLLGNINFRGSNQISLLGIWFGSVFMNAMMQELLIHGYIYQLIKEKYNIILSTIITTGLFTLMHGGAFEAGISPVLNVLTMSLLMTVILEYTASLLTPIMIHFVWNAIGSLLLGGVSLADDYPHVLNAIFSGNKLISGGIYKIEGSIIVLLLNILLITIFIILKQRNKRTSILYSD